MYRKIICALDTGNLDEAKDSVRRLSPFIHAFKIGHGLVLPNGLGVIDELQDLGAERIFLDLKFHDIPNSVALAVREAAKHNVWMLTLHTSGGPAMMAAAAVEARMLPEDRRPILLGVSILTSVDEHMLKDHLGCIRSLEDQMVYLSKLAVEAGLDGVVCSPEEVKPVRNVIHRNGIVVCPGIRRPGSAPDDQVRIGTATKALSDGADYLVIGRALMQADDPEAVFEDFGLLEKQ